VALLTVSVLAGPLVKPESNGVSWDCTLSLLSEVTHPEIKPLAAELEMPAELEPRLEEAPAPEPAEAVEASMEAAAAAVPPTPVIRRSAYASTCARLAMDSLYTVCRGYPRRSEQG
jgi:hypothetical protein